MLNGNKFLIMSPEIGEINPTSSLSMLGSPMQMMLKRIVAIVSELITESRINHPLLELMAHEESYSYRFRWRE